MPTNTTFDEVMAPHTPRDPGEIAVFYNPRSERGEEVTQKTKGVIERIHRLLDKEMADVKRRQAEAERNKAAQRKRETLQRSS